MTVVTMTFSSSDLTNNNDVIALEGWKTSGPFNILPLAIPLMFDSQDFFEISDGMGFVS